MLLEALCLRRTKDVIKLPGLRQRVRMLEFSPAERSQYNNTTKTLMRTIRHRINGLNEVSKVGLFQANLQMRLLCNHGTFQRPFSWHRRSHQDEREAMVSALGQHGQIICAVCHLPMPILGSGRLGNGDPCPHVLCSECLEESNVHGAAGQTQHCHMCVRRPADVLMEAGGVAEDVAMPDWPPTPANRDDGDNYFNAQGYSTKMKALVEDVEVGLWATKRQVPCPATISYAIPSCAGYLKRQLTKKAALYSRAGREHSNSSAST